jgi:hypothetical protein
MDGDLELNHGVTIQETRAIATVLILKRDARPNLVKLIYLLDRFAPREATDI